MLKLLVLLCGGYGKDKKDGLYTCPASKTSRQDGRMSEIFMLARGTTNVYMFVFLVSFFLHTVHVLLLSEEKGFHVIPFVIFFAVEHFKTDFKVHITVKIKKYTVYSI